MNKAEQLSKIVEEIENCEICKVGKSGKAVPGEGNSDADVVFIGEAPGKTEAKTGRPFIGRSGQLLRSLIREVGLTEEDVFITSPVKYLPDRGTPTSEDIAHGRIHLIKQLSIIQPKFVVLLGRVAAEGVLESRVPDGTRQSRILVTAKHGSIIQEQQGVRYFLTYHPAAAVRFAKFRPVIKEDFTKLKTLL